MIITPDQASDLLFSTTPGPWEAYDPGDGTVRLYGADNTRLVQHVTPGDAGSYLSQPDGTLAAAAPDMAATIAGLTWQWAVKVGDRIEQMNDRAMAEDAIDGIEHGTLVCRLVSEWEVTDGDNA